MEDETQNQTRLNAHRRRRTLVVGGLFAFLAVLALPSARALTGLAATAVGSPDPAEVAAINQQLQEKRQSISELEAQRSAVEKTLAEQQRTATTIEKQLVLLDGEIANTESSLKLTQLELDRVNLELELLQVSIDAKEEQAVTERSQLADVIRRMNRQDQRTPLEVALAYNSFSQFWTEVKSTEGLQASLQDHYAALVAVQQALEQQQQASQSKKDELAQQQTTYIAQQAALEQQQSYKSSLLSNAQSLEQQYQGQLGNLQAESQRVNAEISSLEQQMREKLGGAGDPLASLIASPLIWPADHARGISAGFHDPSYPFRCTASSGNNCIGEHPAIDIRAYQGSPVRAAADGYVAIARNLDWIRDERGRVLRPAYNYVSILHAENLSTVYGHLSVVSVTEDQFVKQGQVIGLSGATPGTAGAGLWTTGPHLHFEVRLNGIPVNPISYLP